MGADGDAVYRLTGGNAFFVTEVLATGGNELPADRPRRGPRASRRRWTSGRGACSRSPRSCPPAPSSGCSTPSLRRSSALSMTSSPRASLRADGDDARVPARARTARGRGRGAAGAQAKPARGDRRRPVVARSGRDDPARLAHHADEAGLGDSARGTRPSPLELPQRRRRIARLRRSTRGRSGMRGRSPHASAPSCSCPSGPRPSSQATTAPRSRRDARLSRPTAPSTTVRRGGDALAADDPYIRAGENAEAEDASRRSIELLETEPRERDLARRTRTRRTRA